MHGVSVGSYKRVKGRSHTVETVGFRGCMLVRFFTVLHGESNTGQVRFSTVWPLPFTLL